MLTEFAAPAVAAGAIMRFASNCSSIDVVELEPLQGFFD